MAHDLLVIILTRNEERDLPSCLECIPNKYPVVVVDSGSFDRTIEIARNRGCRILENPWGGFAAQRNFALQKCGGEARWILFVDADEHFPNEFFEWFEENMSYNDGIDAVLVPSLLVFRGRELRYAPGYPIYHARLVRAGCVTFVNNHTGHGESIPDDVSTGRSPVAYRHYFYDGDLCAWMLKHVGNASKEYDASKRPGTYITGRARGSMWLGRSLLRIPARFAYHYFLRRGFRDGREGLEYSLMYAWYEGTKYVMGRCGVREAEVL